jgi:hypothetical protein
MMLSLVACRGAAPRALGQGAVATLPLAGPRNAGMATRQRAGAAGDRRTPGRMATA